MPFKLTTEIIAKIILWTVLWTLLLVLSAPLMAATNESSRTSKSISFIKNTELDKTTKDTQLRQVDADIMPMLNTQGFRLESTVKALHVVSSDYNNHGEISIYDATTLLISDFNENGFYHRFSISIDADTIYNTAYIYARLYLSFEGGPWNHYATSDNYHIHLDSEADTFVIETELADGFPPGYYDIRIELYDADINHWLLSYGSYDDASLNALPLEDSYYDDQHEPVLLPVETNIVVAGHGGSMSWWLFFLPVVIAVLRQHRFAGQPVGWGDFL